MKTPRIALILGLAVLLAAPAHADQNLVGNVTITGGTSSGNLNVTGSIDNVGSTLSLGALSAPNAAYPGVMLTYANDALPGGAADSLQFLVNRNPASWLWLNNTGTPTAATYVKAMRLDSAHQLILFQSDSSTAGITLTPGSSGTPTSTLSLGTATLSGLNGTFTATGNMNFTGTDGSLALSSSGVALSAVGGNKNITLTPSGSGNTILNGNVGIGTNNPTFKLDVLNNNFNAIRASGNSTNSVGIYVQNTTTNGRQWALLSAGGGPAGGVGSFSIWDDSGGGNRFNITPTGNVGIGTINPGAKLETNGNAANPPTSGTTSGGIFRVRGVNNVIDMGVLNGVNGAWIQAADATTLAVNYSLGLNPNGGYVGIGTTAPASQLHLVNGNPGVLGPYYSYQMRADSAGNTGLLLSTPTANAAYIYHNTPIDGASAGIKFDGNARYMSFFTVNGTERMRIDNVGNVGIGTPSPGTKLEVNGNVSLDYGHLLLVPGNGSVAADGNYGVYWQSNGAGAGASSYGIYRTSGPWTANNYQQLMMAFATGIVIDGGVGYGKSGTVLQPNGGNVGIGTATPGAKLSISAGASTVDAENIRFNRTEDGNRYNSIYSYSDDAGNARLTFRVHDGVTGTSQASVMTLKGNGNVGIGTIDPGAYKLAVKGSIHAQEVVVDNSGWADYVFDTNYRLAPLSEVEQHIKAEKHLPGIPSAQEIAEHGVSMGDMQSKLLSKIEELTLHMIAQEKQMNAQAARIAQLELENRQLRSASANP